MSVHDENDATVYTCRNCGKRYTDHFDEKIINSHKNGFCNKILNVKNGIKGKYVYIGRANKGYALEESIFHNPFVIGKDGTREEVIEKFKEYAYSNQTILDNLYLLDGKYNRIGCWCDFPHEDCHGRILLELREKQKSSKLQTKLTDINKEIVFEEEAHTYFLGKKEYFSVTRLLGLYKEPFDPDGIIAATCAKREGIRKSEILARWEKTKDDACVYGTKIHGQVEHFLKTGEIEEKEDKDIVEQFAKIKFRGKVYSEIGLHSKRYGLAGTSDIISLDGNTAIISDIKTNKRFDLKSKYNKKYLYPINHIPESHLHGYSLQILIYGEMVKEHGFDFEPGKILWVNPETRKVEKFDVLDLRKEVQDLLGHYKQIRDF